jgi:carboxylesterase
VPADLRPYSGPQHEPFILGEGPGQALLIHGFPGTPAEMRPLGEALAGDGWRAQGLLLPGFGPGIVTLETCTIEDWIHAAQSEWDAIQSGSGPRLLLGYSMGGALALILAAQQPPDLLVLVAPFWKMPGFLPRLVPLAHRFYPRFRPFKKSDFSDPRLRQMLASILPDVDLDDLDIQQTIREEFILPLGVINEMFHLGRQAHRTAAQVACPVIILQGAEDPLVRPKETRRLAKHLARCQPDVPVDYLEIPGGHDLLVRQGCAPVIAALRASNLYRPGAAL